MEHTHGGNAFYLFSKSLIMSVARVSVAEFKTEDGSKNFTEDYAKQYHDIFPTAEASLSVRTGPTSSIWVTIYPNDQAVEQSFEVRTKFMKDRDHFTNLDESFFYEAEMDFFLTEEDHSKDQHS